MEIFSPQKKVFLGGLDGKSCPQRRAVAAVFGGDAGFAFPVSCGADKNGRSFRARIRRQAQQWRPHGERMKSTAGGALRISTRGAAGEEDSFRASYALVFACWRAFHRRLACPFLPMPVVEGRRRVSSHAVYGGMRVCCVASASDASRRARLTGKVRKVPSIICPVGRKFSRCHRSGPTCFGGRTAAYGSAQGPPPDAGKFFLDMPGSGFAPAGDREMFHYPADLKILPGPFLDVRLKGGGRTCSLSRRKLRASRAENAQWGRGLAIFLCLVCPCICALAGVVDVRRTLSLPSRLKGETARIFPRSLRRYARLLRRFCYMMRVVAPGSLGK